MKISIKDGSKRKKFLHDLSHDVSTTADFGFCQPLMSREINAQDTVNLSIPQFVRLGVVVKPTFGRIHLRTYNKFVPVESVYEPWGSFMAGQSYTHGQGTFIPDQVYNMKVADLWKLCCLHSELCCFAPTSYTSDSDSYTYNGINDQNIISNLDFDAVFDMLWPTGVGGGVRTDISTVISGLYDDYSDQFPQNPSGSLSYYDWFVPTFYQTDPDDPGTLINVLLCGKFTRAGKNLRSILLGCGFQFNLACNDYKSLLPLMSYYKAYFDLFNPNRDLTWKETNLYYFTEALQSYGSSDAFSSAKFFEDSSIKTHNFIKWFLEDLPQCYYTSNPDYVSAHITGTALYAGTMNDEEVFDLLDAQNTPNQIYSANANANANLEDFAFNSINRSALRVLDVLSKRINVHTAIGTRIKEYLRSVFGSAYLEDDVVDNLGSQNLDINISDVMSFAETAQGTLGEYAGMGIGSIPADKAEKFNFKAPTTGYLVSMIALVPESRYSQGIDPLLNHIHRREFFDPDFDAITLLPTPQYNIYGVSEIASSFGKYDKSFGNIPVYSEYKIANNVLNGDLSRQSTRNTFLPFTLDKLLPYTQVYKSATPDQWSLRNVNPDYIVNGTVWRYINLYRWLGQFNRIFLTSGGELNMSSKNYNFWTDNGSPEDNSIMNNKIIFWRTIISPEIIILG